MRGRLVLTRDQVRRVDQLAIDTYGMNSLVLMENAARGCVDCFPEGVLKSTRPIVICCGKGNNGGDGFAIARHLDNAGCEVAVFLLGRAEELTPDAAANHALLRLTDVVVYEIPDGPTEDFRQSLAGAAYVIDALLGTGTRGEVREPFASTIAAMNEAGIPVGAVDVPSGLDADTGRTLGPCVIAERTWTFVGEKPGFCRSDGPQHVGTIFPVDIGVPRRIIAEAME